MTVNWDTTTGDIVMYSVQLANTLTYTQSNDQIQGEHFQLFWLFTKDKL
jgi:hypothetical protein